MERCVVRVAAPPQRALNREALAGRFAQPCRAAASAGGTLCALLVAGLALAGGARAAGPGDLDPSFNQTGMVTTGFGAPVDAAALGVAVQGDGKIVLPVSFDTDSNSFFAVMRLHPDGNLDASFGGGVVILNLGTAPAQARAVAIQKDGKIVAAGFANFGAGDAFFVVRFNPDGTRDNTFGFGRQGVTVVSFGVGVRSQAFAVTIQKDGKIVAAGFTATGDGADFALARLNADGIEDPTFNGVGQISTDFGSIAVAFSVAVQRDGRIVAAGASGEDFALARYRRNGSLDPSFSRDGKLTTDLGGEDEGRALALQKDGRIVVAGLAEGLRFGLARYQKNGRLDRSFDGDGRVSSTLVGVGQAFGVAIQKDGKIVAAGLGTPSIGVETDFLLARYEKNGGLDPSFGQDGFLTTDFGGRDGAAGVAVQKDGRIVAAGQLGGSSLSVAVARYLAQ